MIRLLHTADVQLGMRATEVPEVAYRVRQQRLDTLGRLVALAKEETVNLVLVAGDLFEDNQVSAETVYRAASTLQDAAPIPVYVLPGNHDPLTADSVYHRSAFRDHRPTNVVILDGEEPISLPGGLGNLYPCPCRQRRSSFDPSAELPQRVRAATEGVQIAVAHGCLAIEGRYSPDDHPISPDAAMKAGLDYLALGHWHSWYLHDERTAYPGTPEGTAFGERDSGTALLVSIEKRGAKPHIETRRVGELDWMLWDVDLTAGHAAILEEQRHKAQAISSPEKTLLRVILRGVVDVEAAQAINDFEAWLRAQGLLYVELRREVMARDVMMTALGRLAEQDSVIASIVSDLQALAALDTMRLGAGSPLPSEPLPVEELLALWNSAKGDERVDRDTAVTAALTRLAQLAREVAR
jgi:DNA repair exonuclease SbcCD nuclease subunit